MLVDKIVVPEHLPVLFSHESRELPVGRTVSIARTPTSMRATFQWLENDARASAVENAFDQGMLAASVGVRVLDAQPNRHGGFDLAGELVEWSLVGVPANPECVRLVKMLGLADTERRGDEIVLTLRDDGPTNNPGKPQCPGPGVRGCQWEHPMAIEECPATSCPIRGESIAALRSTHVLVDPDPVSYEQRTLPEIIAAVLRDVVDAEVTKQAPAARTRIIGRID